MTFLLAATSIALAAAAVWLAVVVRQARQRASDVAERLRAAEAELVRARTAGQRFLAAATHELRTPITAIMGYQELLEEGIYGPLDEKTMEAVKRIGRASDQLLHLLDGTLEIVRMDVADIELHLETVDLGAVLRKAAAAAAVQARERGGELRADLPDDLPSLTMDPERLVRTIDLALTAAVRGSPGGKLQLTARPAGTGVAVEVGGTSLNPELLSQVQDNAADRTGALQAFSASGLRLSIAHNTARLLGGELRLEPRDGRTLLSLRIEEISRRSD